ncbi:unnamed protein product, partial [marine sediment metagenome]
MKVKFSPEGKTAKVQAGETILEAARKANAYINSACGGDGICGKCKVIVKKGSVKSPATNLLSRDEVQKGYVLACQAVVQSDLEIEVAAGARPEEAQIVVDGQPPLYSRVDEMQSTEKLEKKIKFETSPLATKMYLELPAPTLKDNTADLQRIYSEIRKQRKEPIMQTGLAVVKQLSQLLRDADWKVTVTLGKRNDTTEVVQVERGDTSARNFGIAVDVGTTTVVAKLIDLATGNVLSAKGTYNKQISYGEDVI